MQLQTNCQKIESTQQILPNQLSNFEYDATIKVYYGYNSEWNRKKCRCENRHKWKRVKYNKEETGTHKI